MFISRIIKCSLIICSLLAIEIEKLLLPSNPKYKLVLALLLNFFFSIIISLFISLTVSFFLLAFNLNFSKEFFSYFIILLILFSLFLATNLYSSQNNLPKIMLNIFFNLKVNFSKIFKVYLGMIGYFLVFYSVTWLLFIIIHPMMLRYEIDEVIAFITSVILAAGITLAGFFGFPLSKENRVLNELILSPILLIASISIGFFLYVKMPFSDIDIGSQETTGYVILLFIITSIIQVSSYLSKVFLNIQALKKFDEKINHHARLGKKIVNINKTKFIRFKNIFLASSQVFFEFLLKNYKNKYFYLELSVTLIFSSIILVFLSLLIYILQYLVQNINLSFFGEVTDFIIKSMFILFIILVLCYFFKELYSFKSSNKSSKRNLLDKFDKFNNLLLLLFLLISFSFLILSFFLIQFSFTKKIIISLILIYSLSEIIYYIIKWLFQPPHYR